jgi:hypothetical protein
MAPLPRQATVSNDRQQPGARVAVAISVEVPEGAKHGVLNDILSVVLVAQEISREGVPIV